MLQARELSRAFGKRQALRGVSLDVGKGEVVALLGPNGAGKSTLLQILAGVLKPTSGTVRVGNVMLPGGEREVGRVVGFVPQGESLYPELTVAETVRFFGAVQGVPARGMDTRVRAALDEVGLAARAKDRAGDLSGGLRQRLALAASLVHDPAVLLLDEPGTGLDVLAQERLHRILRNARTKGRAILLSSHSLDEAARVADRVVFLVDGRIERVLAPSEAHTLAARFRELEAGA